MAFQLNQRRGVTAPAAQHAGQRGQQQIVDLSPVGARRLLQQLPGALAIEAHADGLCVTILPTSLRAITRQLGTRPGQLCLPPAEFFTQRFTAGIRLQAGRPVLEGTGFRRQFHRLLRVQLAIHGLQIVQQHAP
ncbi:hypothetical protein D3C86_1583000 [compost metagenome]